MRNGVTTGKADGHEEGGGAQDLDGGLVLFGGLHWCGLRWRARWGLLRNGEGGGH